MPHRATRVDRSGAPAPARRGTRDPAASDRCGRSATARARPFERREDPGRRCFQRGTPGQAHVRDQAHPRFVDLRRAQHAVHANERREVRAGEGGNVRVRVHESDRRPGLCFAPRFDGMMQPVKPRSRQTAHDEDHEQRGGNVLPSVHGAVAKAGAGEKRVEGSFTGDAPFLFSPRAIDVSPGLNARAHRASGATARESDSRCLSPSRCIHCRGGRGSSARARPPCARSARRVPTASPEAPRA